MKRRLMAYLLALCMVLTLLPATALAASANPFTDVKAEDWFYDEVLWAKDEGLMSGTTTTTFAPEGNTTRGMIVAILWRLAGSPDAVGTQFVDVDPTQYYAKATIWACRNGIVSGCGNNTFNPDADITREQLATMLYNYAKYDGYNMTASADLTQFVDYGMVSSYAVTAMKWAVGEKLIYGMGDGVLAPQGSATRAQVAAILYRFDQLLREEPGTNTNTGTYYPVHTHSYSDVNAKYVDGTVCGNAKHTEVCSCGETQEVACVFESVNEDDGSITHTCKVCGYTYSEAANVDNLPVLDTTSQPIVISTAAELLAFNDWLNGAANKGNVSCVLTTDIDLAGIEWSPIKVNGYHGTDVITVDGSGHTIVGLSAPLFQGGFAGGSGIVINYLTIADSEIVSTNTLGSGAFIESVDSMDTITLNNCHLLNSTVTGGDGSRTGGLIGWTAGYNNVNDGAVKTYVTIKDCSVVGCTISSNGSVGGIYGHAGNNAWTYSTIENCIVKDNTLSSTDGGDWRVGVVVGTANVGEVIISSITSSGNTLTQTGQTAPEGQSDLYGRFVPGSTGKLIIDGEMIIVDGQTNITEIADGFYYNTVNETYEITNANGMKCFAQIVNEGVEGFKESAPYNFKGDTVTLATDVDLNNEAWTPIGNKTNKFEGNFDGQNQTISNLNVDKADTSDVGLFGYTINGSVKNLTINNAEVKGYLDVGVVAGTPYTSTYDNITLTGDIKVDGYAYVGGMFGKNAYANLSNLTINASEDSYVKAKSENYRTYVGGVVGFMGEGNITVSNVTSNIDVYGSTCDVGGITGIAHYNNKFENCSSSGDVAITDSEGELEIGGIAGVWHNANGTTVILTGCSYTGTLTSPGVTEFANGGFAGSAYTVGTGKLIIDGIANISVVGTDENASTVLQTVLTANADQENINLSVSGKIEWETGGSYNSTPLVAADNTVVKSVVIDGGSAESTTFTATGDGVDDINAANGATLTFKNLTIVDESHSYAEDAWEFGYLEFGGKLVFENVIFEDPIQLEDGAEATFINCTFTGETPTVTVGGESKTMTMYGVWVSGGTATFTNCKFTGTRGLKIHEAYGSDVASVVVVSCTFDNLTEKPGIAIGNVNDTTVVTIQNSTFTNCQAGDQGKYIYESDTDVNTFVFTDESNNVVNS